MGQLSASCSSIINRARGLADIVKSKFVTYNDFMNSLNESYKDVYETITDSSDDYFVTLTTITVGTSTTAPLNTFEYLCDLPDDFYKLAFLDYNWNGSWLRMRKFSKDGRNNYAAEPMYRFQGSKLWVVGGMFNSTGFQLRIGYYPAPDTIYFPDQKFNFNTGLLDSQKSLLQYPEYLPGNTPTPMPQDVTGESGVYNGMIMVRQGTGIIYTSNQTGDTTTILASAAALSYPKYYKGYVYWIQAGDLYGAAFDPDNPVAVTPVAMTSSTTVTWFNILAGVVYFVDAGTAKSVSLPQAPATISGAAITSPFTPPSGILAYFFTQSYPVWVTSGGVLTINNVATTISASYAVSDGIYIYTISNRDVYRHTVDFTTPSTPVVTASEIIASDIAYMGNTYSGWIGTIGFDSLLVTSYSTTPDYVIDYPNNLAVELIAYQTALGVKSKQGDTEGMAALQKRRDEIYARFWDQLRRDDYYPERISNNRTSGGLGGLLGINF